MEKLQFKIRIDAPPAKVYNLMLGLDDKQSYEYWTSVFNPTSTYEGSWDVGSKIAFTGISERGKREGMLGKIIENIPNRYISIVYYGFLDGENEITQGPEVQEWLNTTETYTFEEADETTIVTIGAEVTGEFADYFQESWPKALEKLKALVEQG